MNITLKKIHFYLLIPGLIVCYMEGTAQESAVQNAYSQSITILSYNVKNCLGMDGVTDYTRVAEIIKRISPDIVALQELDSATQRSKGVVVLDELARLTGMHKIYGASIGYQGGKYGIGLLTAEKPVGWKRVPLPGREEKRSLLIVELKDVVIGCTHFSLNEEDRLESTLIVNNSFKDYSKPVFLAGDLNASPGSAVIKSIKRRWNILNDTAMFTIPADNPRKCIDFILELKTSGLECETVATKVEYEPVASDHLPVWVRVLF